MPALLEATDRKRRLLQHGSIFAGIFLLTLAGAAIKGPRGVNPWALAALALGLAAIVASGLVEIRWDVAYKGHAIRFVNHPWSGEQLYIDGELVARGGIGIRMVLQGTVKSGEGAGDRIEAVSEAGLLSFRCKITATPAAKS
jgi:hypothetical protein